MCLVVMLGTDMSFESGGIWRRKAFDSVASCAMESSSVDVDVHCAKGLSKDIHI